MDLFQGGVDCVTCRIPGVVVTAKGTALAYCETRKRTGNDYDEIEVRLRRSTDGGKTWDAPRVIAHRGVRLTDNPHNKKPEDHDQVVNNPVAIVDRQTGAVHFLYCVNYKHCFSMRSDDDGLTFSAPVEITPAFDAFRPECDWHVIATGPGHGIQLRTGRLIVPAWLSYGREGVHGPSVAATVFSDDHGKSWHRGDIALPDDPKGLTPNETAAVELADGRVMLNSRNRSPADRRLVTTSADGVTHWSKPIFDPALFEPVCMASLARYSLATPAGGINRLLFANPHNLKRDEGGHEVPAAKAERANVSVKVSYDEGKTWPVNKSLEPGPSGYSDLAVLPDGTILCLYEQPHARLTLARFSLEWLTDGADSAGR